MNKPKIINLEELLSRFANDRAFVDELLESYKSDVSSDLPTLEKAVKERDAAKIIAIAHGLKGISANMVMEPMREVFLRLEMTAKGNLTEKAPELFEEIKALLEQFEEEFEALGNGAS